MKRLTAIIPLGSVLAFAAAAAVLANASSAGAQGRTQTIGAVRVTAATIDITSSQWVLTGRRPHAWTLDGKLDIRADKIVVDLNRQAKNKQDYVSRITALGSTEVKVKLPDRSVSSQSDRATYYGAEQKAVFEGDVKALVTDQGLAEPSTLDADKITVWLQPGPDQARIRIEGAPAELHATPKEQPKAKPGANPGSAEKKG